MMDRHRRFRFPLQWVRAAVLLTTVMGMARAQAPAPNGAPAMSDGVDPIMGEYVGTCTVDGKTSKAEAKVWPEGSGAYRIALLGDALASQNGRIELQAGNTFVGEPLQVTTDADGLEEGLNYAYYEGDWDRLPDFDTLTPVDTGNVATFDLSPRRQDDYFAFRFSGFVSIDADGDYQFVTASDDGSRLTIGDALVVDNDGLHGAVPQSGHVTLKAGLHPIVVTYFEKSGGEELKVSVAPFVEPHAGEMVPVSGEAMGVAWTGEIGADHLVAAAGDAGTMRFELTRSSRTSPTVGLRPPPGAVVLLPLQADGRPSLDAWTNRSWRPLADGSMEVGGGNNSITREFGDVTLHLEFRCPYEPTGRGQGRGNSGVYLQSRYEVQVLDSFGLIPGMGDCGAIYGVAIPKVNACLPPATWQTYDIVFRAGRFTAEGEVLEAPLFVSVKLNGIVIHENQPVPGATTAAGAQGHTARGPLMLQDHGHRVHYRNIWIEEP